MTLFLSLLLLLSVGCASTTHKHMFTMGADDSNMWTPGFAMHKVFECFDEDGNWLAVQENEIGVYCPGTARPFDMEGAVAGLQPGHGPAMVGTLATAATVIPSALILADGIRDSASKVNQTGGGASQSQAQQQKASSYSKSGYKKRY